MTPATDRALTRCTIVAIWASLVAPVVGACIGVIVTILGVLLWPLETP